MADVFVSYKREDVARVRKLVDALRASGLIVWWDEDIPASAPWEATIEKALADAKTVIVCWSPDAVASENVRSEARAAREDGRLIQVFVRPCTLPLFFGERQGVDLSSWRGRTDDKRIAELVDAVRVRSGSPKSEQQPPRRRSQFGLRVAAVIAAFVLAIGTAVGWWLLTPAKASGPQTIAILPFRALNPADANLVDAIWDDTRGAISRNPNLRVLGRTAVEALARQNLNPTDYRRKVGADYLLDGGVQRQGNRVQINVSLVSTKDGSEVWNDRIGGNLDDVFAFQQRIAQEVEGKIRGRVAPGGGVKVQNIATSGEVYSIYADARASLRKRDRQSVTEAIRLLRQALAIDPNYAPAWTDLGSAITLQHAPDMTVAERMDHSVRYIRHSLELAPNLAHAHAALAMVQNFPPSSEADLKRAVELDPSDAEAWLWLGNLYSSQYRNREAATAHKRAIEVEPLWYPPMANRILELASIRDRVAMDNEIERAKATGDPVYSAMAQAFGAFGKGHPGDTLRIFLALRKEHPEVAPAVDSTLENALIFLGYPDLAMRLGGEGPALVAAYLGTINSVAQLRALYKRPQDFWTDADAPVLVGRQFRKNGKSAQLVDYFHATFSGVDDYADRLKLRPNVYVYLAPTLAVNLRDNGYSSEAEQVLTRAELILVQALRIRPLDTDLAAQVSLLRGAEGRDQDAIRYLQYAVAHSWLPNGGIALDIADEPAYSALVNRPDFQALRREIFARQADERRRAGPIQDIYAALGQRMAA
jgi:TolB-like protein/Flp pilus assembly protein TadD